MTELQQRPPVADWATDFDFFEPAFVDDPYPVYEQLRTACPVARSGRYGGMEVLTRWSDLAEAVHDPATFSSRRVAVTEVPTNHPGYPLPPINADPPEHTALRRVLLPFFSPAAIARWEQPIRAICDRMLNELDGRTQCNLATEYAQGVPSEVTAMMLGVPASDGDMFRQWIHDLLEVGPTNIEVLKAASNSTNAYLAELLASHRANPRPDAVGYLLDQTLDGEPLDDETMELRFGDYLKWRDELVGGGLKDAPELAWVIAIALVGAAIAIVFRHKAGLFLVAAAVAAAIAFIYVPQGRLWNTRLLPFYYLSLYLLAALAVGQLHQLLAHARARRAVGAVAGSGVVVLQLLMVWDPRVVEVPVVGWSWTPQIYVNDHYVPFLIVGVALVASILAAELVTATAEARRRGGILALGGAVLVQTMMVIESDLRVDDRGLPYFYAFLGVATVVAAVEVMAASFEVRRRLTVGLVGLGALLWLALVLGPSGWNTARGLLPYFFAVLGLLALSAGLELRLTLDPDGPPPSSRGTTRVLRSVTAAGGALFVLTALALPLRVEPGSESGSVYRLGPFSTTDQSFVDGWAGWNYRGYEGSCAPGEAAGTCGPGEKPYFPEYEAVVTTMTEVGEEHGCGRAMWEYGSELDSYGTPMALMLLPHWTDGCIGSMEGLYFEASTTTPYHFINQDELSKSGSNAQRGLPYGAGEPTSLDFDQGIKHLQMLGVRYYMAFTPEMVDLAREHPTLTEIAVSKQRCRDDLCPEGITDNPDRWVIFEVADAPLVQSLQNEPVVLTGVDKGHTCEAATPEEDPRGRTCEGWLDPAIDWYVDESLWDIPFAESGPDSWTRIPVDEWMETHEAPATPVDPVEVSNIDADRQSISFDVSEPGTPVVVKASYFPNWKVEGAEGPYRVTPNLMVVVPTDTHVELTFGRTGVDYLASFLSVAGIVLLVVLFLRPGLVVPSVRTMRQSEDEDATEDRE